MKKRVTISILLAIVLMFTFGCSNQEAQETEKSVEEGNNIDKEFIKDFSKATNTRWNMVNKSEEKQKELGDEYYNEEYLEDTTEFVEAETELLYKYEDSEFDDPKLGKITKEYIEGLKMQEESLEYYFADVDKWNKLWSDGYDKRSVSLFKLVDDYDLDIDEENLKDMRQNAQLVEEEKEISDKLDGMFRNTEFKVEEESGSWKDYEAIVENTTDKKFDHFILDIKLIDEDGVTVDTTQANTEHWEPGEKVRFEFMTDKDFKEIKWQWSYYDQ